MKLSIIIPVYNEGKTLLRLLKKVEAAKLPKGIKKEIIMVDDCSSDGSRKLLKKLEKRKKYKIFYHGKNRGKGAAIKTALRHTTGDLVIFQDADLEYDPKDYRDLVQTLLNTNSTIVFGSRFGSTRAKISFRLSKKSRLSNVVHFVGNKFLLTAFNILYGTRLTDVEPCYKLFRKKTLKSVKVESDRFEYDIELTCKLLRKGNKIIQIPISYYPRSFEEGKKITWKDGIIALHHMVKHRFF